MPPSITQHGPSPSLSGKKANHHHIFPDWTGQQSGPFRQPTPAQRVYMAGLLHRSIDVYFVLAVAVSVVWGVLRLLLFEIPFHCLTGFTQSTLQFPSSWGWKFAFCMACARRASEWVLSVSHLRMTSTVITWFIPVRMRLIKGGGEVDVIPRIQLRVNLDQLLVPERKTLAHTREALGLHGAKSNPLVPPKEVFESFLPHPPPRTNSGDVSNTNNNSGSRYVPNLPEESGWRNADGTYILEGEWIEALPNEGDTRPRSNVVLLYCHGGGFVFCSATFHRQLLARMILEFGPGARAFVVDYRLAPEHPFPAAIHDVYAAYLYLTQGHSHHPAVQVVDRQRHRAAARGNVPIDPKNIVLGGDSAGAAVVAGFKLYMRDYVQPSLPVKLDMPFTTILLSGWMDITTSMPATSELPTLCYTPSIMGAKPDCRKQFDALSKFNFGVSYLCGDSHLVPNERNAMGQDLLWEWYRHLSQHPLVNAVYTANLEGFGDTLLQAGTFDRLRDDTRLMAHRLGQDNKGLPETRVRVEIYRDMVHVHQFFEFLPLAEHALKNIVAFVEDSQKRHRHNITTTKEQEGSEERQIEKCSSEADEKVMKQQQQPCTHIRKGSSPIVIKAGTSSTPIAGAEDRFQSQKGGSGHVPSSSHLHAPTMAATASDSTEWIIVELNGSEVFSMEGTPIEFLESCWRGVRRQ